MKKIAILFTATALFTCIATSCNPLCECTSTTEGEPTETYEIHLREVGQKNCNELSYVQDTPYGRTVVECKKKSAF